VPTLTSQNTQEPNLDEILLAEAEHLEWLLRPILRSTTPSDRAGGLVFHKFQSMSQTWSRAGA
jgi:hypothetical protein